MLGKDLCLLPEILTNDPFVLMNMVKGLLTFGAFHTLSNTRSGLSLSD